MRGARIPHADGMDVPIIRLPSSLSDPVRLFHGAAIERREWDGLDQLARRRLLVRARYAALTAPGIVSHRSAAALWGMPDVDPPDVRLHLITPGAKRTHSGRGVVRHVDARGDLTATSIDGVPVTTVVQTAVDLARTGTSTQAVVVFDHVLRRGDCSRDDLGRALDPLDGLRGIRQARDALAFADPGSDSPGESISRVTLRDLRVPTPVLQQEFTTDAGRFRVDFWWPEHGVVGEFDGRVKYDDHEVVWREKLREDALRRLPQMRGFARWTMREARSQAALARVVLAAGLPVPRAGVVRR